MDRLSMDEKPFSTEATRVIPGPKELPLVGSIREFSRDPLRFLLGMHREYGDFATYSLGSRRFIQVNHPEAVQHVLQKNHRTYSKRGFQFDFVQLLMGNGLLLSEGDTWLSQRRLMQPAFHQHQIEGYTQQMVASGAASRQALLQTAGSGESIDMAEIMMRLTLGIVNQTLFSTDVEQQYGGEIEQLSDAISFLIEDVNFRYVRPFYPFWAPTSRNRKYKQAVKRIDQIIYRIIAARRRMLDNDPRAAPQDLLTTLLTARDADTGEGMNDKQLRDEVITLFLAGHETTANALTWTWYSLATHPSAEKALHDELDRVLAGRLPTFADYPNLLYTRRVVDESLRLYPPAWITNRVAEEPDLILGRRIPRDTFIIVSPYVLHRHPAYWSDPEAFRPERFSPEASRQRPKFAYLPFGGGPRLCIGRDFALVEAVLILAVMAQQLSFRLPQDHDLVFAPAATLRPQGGLPMYVKERACC